MEKGKDKACCARPGEAGNVEGYSFHVMAEDRKESGYLLPFSNRIVTNIDFDWKFLRGDVSGEEETHQVNQLLWV